MYGAKVSGPVVLVLQNFVLWIPWNWRLDAETCRNFIYYVWFLVVLCAFVGYCNYLFTIKADFVKWRYKEVILSTDSTTVKYYKINKGLANLRNVDVGLLLTEHLGCTQK